MIRIAHLADLHIGSRRTHDDSPTSGPALSSSERSYQDVEALFERVLALTYDAVVIAGDVFDRKLAEPRGPELFVAFLNALAEHKTPVAIIAGNHDAENGVLCSLGLPANTTLLGRSAPETVVWAQLGVAVHGQSIMVADELHDQSAAYPAPLPGLINIGLLHTSLDGGASKRPCAPASLAALERSGYDYWALGHVHAREVLGSTGRVAYAGGASSRGREEDVSRGFLEIAFTHNTDADADAGSNAGRAANPGEGNGTELEITAIDTVLVS